jgi:hypothetical protein
MSSMDPKDLGQLIFDENPYSAQQPPKKFKMFLEETELAYRDLEWYFKNGENYVAKALRIPYSYTDQNGHEIRDYLLVGFEGGGGD